MVLTGAIDESFIAKSGIAAEVNLMKRQKYKMAIFEVEEFFWITFKKQTLQQSLLFPELLLHIFQLPPAAHKALPSPSLW